MTVDELNVITANAATDYGKLVSTVEGTRAPVDFKTMKDQLHVSGHKITSITERPDKQYYVKVPKEGKADEYDMSLKIAKVTRLALPFQKQIVKTAATFLCGNPIVLQCTPVDDTQKNILAAIQKVWDDNKLDYKSKGLAKKMMGETEVAELWYTEEVEPGYWGNLLSSKSKYTLRLRILARSLGDELFPVFSPTGDMIAFGRRYGIKKEGGEEEKHFDLYTPEKNYFGVEQSGSWVITTGENLNGKIPVIYYSQPEVEWADVQTMIERYELVLSNLSDTNDYFGSPMVVVEGNLTSFSSKGETGKLVEVEKGGKVSYATWTQAPESVKLEMETLQKQIYSLTDTPNISFDEMKGLGTFSGIALKMLFLAAHMKASDKEEVFGESIQRRINYINSFICNVIDVTKAKVQLTVKPRFEYYLPKNTVEQLENITTALNNKILSRETAVSANPLVTDAAAELAKIKSEEEQAAQKINNNINDVFNTA